MTRWAALIAALLAAGPSQAQCLGFQCPPGVLGSGASGAAPPPLDGFPVPAGAYSFRKLLSTYSGPAIRIRRAIDNGEINIGFLGCTAFTGCPWDEATALGHCAGTTCFAVTQFDQAGTAQDLTQATAANQPQVIFGCQNGLPCLEFTTSTISMAFGAYTPASAVTSFSAVANRTSGTGACVLIRENGATGNRLATGAALGNTWSLIGGTSGTVSATATDNAWHAAQVVLNGASSSLTIDGTTTTGTAAGSITAGQLGVVGALTTTCRRGEVVFWDGAALSAGEIAALTANQRSFWGF